MKPRLHHALSILALLLASPAYADDITIHIPVDVKNLMPQLGKVGVRCSLLDSNQKWLGGGNYSNFVSLDANGNYKGTLTVKFTESPGVAVQAKSYRCSLALQLKESDKLYANDLTVGTIPDDIGKAKPGAPYVPVVTGPITSGASGGSRLKLPQ